MQTNEQGEGSVCTGAVSDLCWKENIEGVRLSRCAHNLWSTSMHFCAQEHTHTRAPAAASAKWSPVQPFSPVQTVCDYSSVMPPPAAALPNPPCTYFMMEAATLAAKLDGTPDRSSFSAPAHPPPSLTAHGASSSTSSSAASPQSPSAPPQQQPRAVKACLWCGETSKHLKQCGGCEFCNLAA